jgi:hypothetical protein
VGPQGPAGTGNFNGDAGYLVKFTAQNAGGNSAVFEQNNNIGIGLINPNVKLHVKGTNEILRLDGINPTIGFNDPSSVNNYSGYLNQAPNGIFSLGTRAGTQAPIVLSPNAAPAITVYPSGNVVIGNGPTSLNGPKLDVEGSIRIQGGNPGAGKVLRSDNAGLGYWDDVLNKYSGVLNNNMFSISNVSNSLVKIGDIGSFTKTQPNSVIELDLKALAKIINATSEIVRIELRVDNAPSLLVLDDYLLECDKCTQQMTIHAVYKNLSAGNHTISLHAQVLSGGVVSTIEINPYWSTSGFTSVIVKETN